jgi:hypothetical protein
MSNISKHLAGLSFDPAGDYITALWIQPELSGGKDQVAGPDGNGVRTDGFGSFIACNDYFFHACLKVDFLDCTSKEVLLHLALSGNRRMNRQ